MYTTSYSIIRTLNILNQLQVLVCNHYSEQRREYSHPFSWFHSLFVANLAPDSNPRMNVPLLMKNHSKTLLRTLYWWQWKVMFFCYVHTILIGVNRAIQTITSMLSLKMKLSLIFASVSIQLHFHFDFDTFDEWKRSALIFWMFNSDNRAEWVKIQLFVHSSMCQILTHGEIVCVNTSLYLLVSLIFSLKTKIRDLFDEYWFALLMVWHQLRMR